MATLDLAARLDGLTFQEFEPAPRLEPAEMNLVESRGLGVESDALSNPKLQTPNSQLCPLPSGSETVLLAEDGLVAHRPLELGARRQRRNRVDCHEVDRT